jgi:hypothetical protein
MSVSYSYEDKFDELTSCPLNRPHMTILVKFENGAPFRKYFLKLLFWKKIVCTAYSGLCLGRKTTHSAYTSSAQINQSILLHFSVSSAGRRTRTRRATLPQAHRGEPSSTRRGGEIQSGWDVPYLSSVAGKEALPPLLAYFLVWILGASSVVQDFQVRLPHSHLSCSTGDSGPSTLTGLSWISLLMRVRLNPQPHVRVRDLLVMW